MDTKADIWSVFPAIFCINLKSRDDRFLSTCKTLVEMGLAPDRVHFYRTEKDPRGGRFGCAESHMQCLRKALAMNVPYALFLEDDIVPGDGWRKQMAQVQDFLKSGQSFEILRLYSMIRIPMEQVKGDIWQVGSLSGAAYVLSKPFMQKLSKLKYDGVHIDTVHSLAAEKTLDIFPPVFNVSDSASDNEWGGGSTDKGLTHFLKVYQSTFSTRRQLDLQNKLIALMPKFVCQYGQKLLRRGMINGNEFPKELIESLRIIELQQCKSCKN